MLIQVDRSARIRVYPESGGPDTSSIIYLDGRPPTEERLKEIKENIFVCLYATGQYAKYWNDKQQITYPEDSLLVDPKGYPFRVDKACFLGDIKPYTVHGREGDWLEYWYKLNPDTSEMVWGEGMYEEWDYDFETNVLVEKYWKLPESEQSTRLNGKIQLTCDQGSWFVSVNSTSIYAPHFHG